MCAARARPEPPRFWGPYRWGRRGRPTICAPTPAAAAAGAHRSRGPGEPAQLGRETLRRARRVPGRAGWGGSGAALAGLPGRGRGARGRPRSACSCARESGARAQAPARPPALGRFGRRPRGAVSAPACAAPRRARPWTSRGDRSQGGRGAWHGESRGSPVRKAAFSVWRIDSPPRIRESIRVRGRCLALVGPGLRRRAGPRFGRVASGRRPARSSPPIAASSGAPGSALSRPLSHRVAACCGDGRAPRTVRLRSTPKVHVPSLNQACGPRACGGPRPRALRSARGALAPRPAPSLPLGWPLAAPHRGGSFGPRQKTATPVLRSLRPRAPELPKRCGV
jgi:hypothetical protein